MATEPVVKIERLTVCYGKLTAVDELSLEVRKGKVYALLGRNGTGKTSTVRCLLGQRRATGGRLRVLGLDSWKERRRVMERVGVVPETPDVPPETTAEHLEHFMARVTPFWRSADYFGRLESLGVPRRQRFSRLSKGQQRGLTLALRLHDGRWDPRLLDQPDFNLHLGALYLRRRMAGGPLPMHVLIASYNAGPVRIARWSAWPRLRDPDLFIGRLSISETREYVRRVYANYAWYRRLYRGAGAQR